MTATPPRTPPRTPSSSSPSGSSPSLSPCSSPTGSPPCSTPPPSTSSSGLSPPSPSPSASTSSSSSALPELGLGEVLGSHYLPALVLNKRSYEPSYRGTVCCPLTGYELVCGSAFDILDQHVTITEGR